MKILIAGNREYGLAKSLSEIYPTADFLSRSNGYDFGKHDIREDVAKMSLSYDVFIAVSALGDFRQTKLVERIATEWWNTDHKGYLIALGSSADTPVKGTQRLYPVEKRALRHYCRQLSQKVSSENPPNWKVTYIAPGNMHTPRQDEKMPDTIKLNTDYVAEVIEWLINQPSSINISELCLDQVQR